MYYDDFYDEYEDFDRQQQYSQGYFTPPTGEGPTPMIAPPPFYPPFPSWQQGPSGIRSCLNRNTFIWLRNGNSFWFFPTFIGRQTLIGFRWGRIGWTYSRVNLRNIRSYQCF